MFKTLVLFCLLALVAPSLALAQLTLIAQADFDSDTVGNLPDTGLPGGPTGDSLVLTGVGFPGTYTVVDEALPLTDQPLRCERASGAGSFNFGLRVPTAAETTTKIVARFDIAPVQPLNSLALSAILRGPSLSIHGSIRLSAGGMIFTTAWGGALDTLIPAGNFRTDQPNHVEWIVDRESGVQSVVLNGVLVIDAEQTQYINPGTPFESLMFEGQGQSPMDIAIDNLEIYDGVAAPTPVEPVSFGNLKTHFRTTP